MADKVLIFAPRLGPSPLDNLHVSGHAQLPARFALELAKDGWPVQLLTTGLVDRQTTTTVGPTSDQRIQVVTLPDYKPGRPAAGVTPLTGRSLLALVSDARPFVRELRSFARAHTKPAVVHVVASSAALAMLPLFRRTFPGAKVVLTLTGPSVQKIVQALGPVLTRFVDVATAPSEYSAQVLATKIKCLRPEVVRPGIPAVLRTAPLAFSDRNKVSFIRYLTYEGGGDIGARVIFRVAQKCPDIQPVFAVRPHEQELAGVRDLVAKRAAYFKFPDSPPVHEIMRNSRCLVQPFRQATMNPQLSVIEAMRLGTPVVVSDVGPLPELVNNPDLVFPVDDEVGMARAAERLCSEEDYFTDTARAAIASTERYSWQQFVRSMTRIYRTLMNR